MVFKAWWLRYWQAKPIQWSCPYPLYPPIWILYLQFLKTIRWVRISVFSISSTHYHNYRISSTTDQTQASLPYIQFTFKKWGIYYRFYRDLCFSHLFDQFMYSDSAIFKSEISPLSQTPHLLYLWEKHFYQGFNGLILKKCRCKIYLV